MNNLTIIYPYCGEREFLDLQIKEWWSSPLYHRILIDDTGPGDTLPEKIPAEVYKIDASIPWNEPGARNLGILKARTKWIMLCDIDHMLSRESMHHLSTKYLDEKCVYFFSSIIKRE